MHKVAIVGASGYTGAELMRICASHPEFEVAAISGDSASGLAVTDLYPNLTGVYGGTTFDAYTPGIASGADVTFLALPHGESQRLMPGLLEHAKRVVDLSGDFRFSDQSVYETWHGGPHQHPELLDEFVFGLPELFRDDLAGAALIAVAGCYVTASSLALAPVVAAGLIEPRGIVVDAASGVSGAGRGLKRHTAFTTADENFTAYGLLSHKHTPEIEIAVSAHSSRPVQILFTPHLAPMSRGILATCYGRTIGDHSTEEAIACLAEAYAGEPFVAVGSPSPSTKATLGSNSVHITARVDHRTGWTIVIAALDNLGKGAAGQAVQCANISLGLPETMGLSIAGIYP